MAGSLNITDNDSLACSISVDVGADLAILMSDVEGIYNKPPKEEGARYTHTAFNKPTIFTNIFSGNTV